MQGGPTWADNFVDAPIIIDRNLPDRFYKQPMWYALAHVGVLTFVYRPVAYPSF
jgi:hypothetical protein